MTDGNESKRNCATVIAVGDLMLGDSPIPAGYGWRSRYPGNAAKEAIEGLGQVLTGADIVFGNLEAQLARTGAGETRMARDMMRGDPEYAQVLRDLGFNVLAVANNHAMQHGIAAFEESVTTLRQAGIDVAGLRGADGWNAQPVIRSAASGLRLGVLAYSLRPRQYGTGHPSYAGGPESAILADAARLAMEVDQVIVSLHWGEEFVSLPSESEVRFADQLGDAGVALIIGHHPHVVRPVVVHAGTCIAYSLGNTVSDMTWRPEFRRGLVLRCRLGEAEPLVDSIEIETDANYAVRVTGDWRTVRTDAVPGLPEVRYQEAIDDSMRVYRRAALSHMIRNVWRSPLRVSIELFRQKARNLVARVVHRGRGR
jgi:poly-gamma-glutamate synthesis protein (capsule biosynthesis protein)